MSKERKYELVKIDTSLAQLDSVPNKQLLAARVIDNEAHKVFEVEKFLEELNQKLFGGVGKVSPLYQTAEVIVETEKQAADKENNKTLRFKKFFSTRYKPRSLQGGARLDVDSDNIKISYEEKRKINKVTITIYRDINIDKKTFSITVAGGVIPSYKTKTVRLGKIGQGRGITLDLKNLPSGEEIANQVMSNALEILEGFEEKGYISIPKEESAEEENIQD